MVVEIDLNNDKQTILDGKILVAMPSMSDERFERSVIFLCTHSKDGSMGIVVNQRAESVTFSEVLSQLDILNADEEKSLAEEVDCMPIHLGGPLQTERGFVLHSCDYRSKKFTIRIDDRVNLTTTLEIIKDIVKGRGPENALLALGYAGWGPGQLEREIQENGWLVCNSNDEIIFSDDLDMMYDLALRNNGIDPALLSSTGGHA